jgi:predicted transcriptional regulator
MSKTPLRAVRVDPELWETARAIAAANGDTLSAIIRDALREYVHEKRQTPSTLTTESLLITAQMQ